MAGRMSTLKMQEASKRSSQARKRTRKKIRRLSLHSLSLPIAREKRVDSRTSLKGRRKRRITWMMA
jgi:hypothetical protein